MCQSLRIASFTVTQLPAPNYHCRSPEATAVKPMPDRWWGHLYIQNLKQQVRAAARLREPSICRQPARQDRLLVKGRLSH